MSVRCEVVLLALSLAPIVRAGDRPRFAAAGGDGGHANGFFTL